MKKALARLGIDMSAKDVAARGLSAKELKSAYIRAAKRWHPDGKPEADKAQFEKEFKLVSAAYSTLRPLCTDK